MKAPVIIYRITFRSGLIFTPMEKIAVFTLRRCAPCHPAFFCIAISNASKFGSEILRNSTLTPGVLERTGYTAHTGLLFIPPTKRSDFCSAAHTGLQWRNVNNSSNWYKNCDVPM